MWSAAGCGVPVQPTSSSSSGSSPAPTPIPTGFCDVTLSDEKKKVSYEFNLTSLYHDNSSAVDYFWYRSAENNIYYVNFCGQSAAGCSRHDTSVCIRLDGQTGHKFVSGGSTSTQKFASTQGKRIYESVTVTYSNGEDCDAYGGKKVTNIVINCQSTATPGYIYDMDEINQCETTLYMWSSAGCGKRVPYVDPYQ